MFLLGDACELLVSPEWRAANPERYEELRFLSYLNTQGYPVDEPRSAAELLARIPLDLPALLSGPLAVRDTDPLPPRIERRFAHKRQDENVLLSRPHRLGRFWHFNLLQETEELRFDHSSEHVHGLLLLEAMRQACLAGAQLSGLPPETAATLLSHETVFHRYVSLDAPIILRIYAFFTDARERPDKPGFGVNQIFQWGQLCASGIISGYLFTDSDHWSGHRSFALRMMERSAKGFARRLGSLAQAAAQ